MSFDQFDLDPRSIAELTSQNIEIPTPVQAQAIPIALEGKDLVAIAQTGTGKTLGFTLPALTLLSQKPLKPNSMLILVPTRELCMQVYEVARNIGNVMNIRCEAIYGGVNLERQATSLKKGVEVIVATPGRLIDHVNRRNINLRDMKILVLDEADRMLDMGFLPDIQYIVGKMSKERQTMMFSATFPDDIARFAERMMHEPERITVGTIAKPVDNVRQILYPVAPEKKSQLLLKLLENEDPNSVLIFLRTKDRTELVSKILENKGYKVATIHGDRSQGQRQQALDGFRKGRFSIMVATDVAARGLDIDGVSHVINYDIPLSPDDYIHRIGRTARAEADGDAITFVSPTEFQALGAIERTLGYNLDREDSDDAPRILTLFHPKGSKGAKNARRRPRRMLRRR